MSKAGKRLEGRYDVSRWELALHQAGLETSPGEFAVLRLGCACLSFTIVYLLLHAILPGFAFGLIGFFAPLFYLRSRRGKRLRKSSEQLVEALGALANAMRAGFSFLQSIQLVAREVPDPIGPEFAQLVRDLNLGVPFDDALKDLVVRLPDTELELVTMALTVQRSTGGNMVELLETIQETVRGRIRIRQEIKTLTAQGRYSAWVVSLLPLLLGLFMATSDTSYFDPMFHHLLGIGMLLVGVVMTSVGWFFIRKIVRIEV